MSTLESYIERKACILIEKELGVKSIKLVSPSSIGWPDRMYFIHGGRPLLIEFKRPGGELSPFQVYRIKWLRKLGYQVEVCYNEHDALHAAAKAVEAAKVSNDSAEVHDVEKRGRTVS